MKALALALLLSTTAAGPRLSTITVDTSTMLPGAAQVFTIDDHVKVTVTRTGDVRNIHVERFGLSNRYTLEPVDGELQVTSRDDKERVVLSPHRIIVDGVPLDTAKLPPVTVPEGTQRGMPRYYVCPKDETMLRVPAHATARGELRCPIDGTPMKPSVGRGSAYFLLQ